MLFSEIPGLTEHKVYWQEKAKLLVCSHDACHIGVSSNELISHLKNQHNIKCASSALEGIVDNPPTNIYNQATAIEPFQGIKFRLGWVCQQCFYGCLVDDSMLKHFQKLHWTPGKIFEIYEKI